MLFKNITNITFCCKHDEFATILVECHNGKIFRVIYKDHPLFCDVSIDEQSVRLHHRRQTLEVRPYHFSANTFGEFVDEIHPIGFL